MTAFNADISVVGIQVIAPEENEDQTTLAVRLTMGQVIPQEGPNGTTVAATLPLGTLRFLLNKESSVKVGEELKIQGEKLKAQSDLTVASSLAEAEQVGSALKDIKNAD